MGVRARTEVYGMFAAVLPQHAQDVLARWPRRKRQGIVPDFVIALPQPDQRSSAASDQLFELKTLHYGTTTYPGAAMDARCGAVDRRAQAVPAEYVTKARRLDHRFCSTPEGEVGPVERRLERFGAVRGVVFGHWAEGSTNAEALLSHAARCGAELHWTRMRAREPTDAIGTLSWMLRRRWGMTAWRAAIRLLHDRLEYVGRGAVAGQMRRVAAREQAAIERRSAHWLFQRRR